MPPVEQRLETAEPSAGLAELEAAPPLKDFPSSILVAAVLYTSSHPANTSRGDPRWLGLALRIGDLLAAESAQGPPGARIDHREIYLWLESYRLLVDQLGEERRARWRAEIGRNVGDLAVAVAGREHFPRYQSPFIRTSTTTITRSGLPPCTWRASSFGNREWEELGGRVMRRFAAAEQTPDGYWGEHSDAGPTTGYDYLTFTGVAPLCGAQR